MTCNVVDDDMTMMIEYDNIYTYAFIKKCIDIDTIYIAGMKTKCNLIYVPFLQFLFDIRRGNLLCIFIKQVVLTLFLYSLLFLIADTFLLKKRCLILKCETKKKQKQKQIEIHGLSKKSKSSSKYDYNFIKFIILIKKNTTIVSKRIEKYNRTEWLKSKNMGKFYALSIPRYFIKWN